MAVGLLRHSFSERGLSDVHVTSAGFLAADRAATEDAVLVLAARGIDISDHSSRVVTPEMLDSADLVLGMARVHVREATVLRRAAFPKLFTLKEIVRRGDEVGARKDGEALGEWLARVGEGRLLTHHLGDSTTDDVADPVGRPMRVYKKTAKELDGLVARFVELAWPEG
jgi:protein-tyrosine phosphatase